MGNYLTHPVTTKDSEDGSSENNPYIRKWGSSMMQGWRKTMEDAHISIPDVNLQQWKGCGLFSVFDGHGGVEVAKFCEMFVPQVLGLKELDENRIGECLREVHHEIDDMLRNETYHQTILSLNPQHAHEGSPAFASKEEKKEKAMSLLESSIQADLEKAKSKGSLSNNDATSVMMKMMLLQRINQQRGTPPPKMDGMLAAMSSTDSLADSGATEKELAHTEKELAHAVASDATSSTSLGGIAGSGNVQGRSMSHPSDTKEDTVFSQSASVSVKRGSASPTPSPTISPLRKGSLPSSPPSLGMGSGPGPGPARLVGCTAVQAVITPKGKVVVANAGDSRAVLCHQGKSVLLSHDHKPNEATEKNRIEQAGGTVETCRPVAGNGRTHYRVNGNLNLSRSIGDLEYKQRADLPPEKQVISSTPDIVEHQIVPGDEFIALGCDGVWDVKSNEEVCNFIRNKLASNPDMPPSKICEELIDTCLAVDPKQTSGIGGDNISMVLVLLDPEAGLAANSKK